MFENSTAAKERHRRFVQRVVLSRMVWGLKETQLWASAPSTADATRGRDVIPFWSDCNLANQCAKGEWANYQATEIPLDQFIQNWLPRMAVEHCLAGTNWDVLHSGHEIEPDALRDELARQSGH